MKIKKLITVLLLISGVAYGQIQMAKDWLLSAKDKIDVEDYTGAITKLNLCIQLYPDWVEAYALRGTAKGVLGDYRGAIADLDKGLDLNEIGSIFYYDPAGIYNSRGVMKNLLGDYTGALADLNKSIEIDSKTALFYFNRGRCKIGFGDIEGGCLDFSKAGELGYYLAYEYIREDCN